MSSRKVKDPKKPEKPTPEKTPENPFERKDSPVPR
jgi:hypothetical protein